MALAKIEFLSEVVTLLQEELDPGETFEAVLTMLEKIVPFDSATLYLYKQKSDQLELLHQRGEFVVDLALGISFTRGNGISGWITNQQNPIILESLSNARPWKERRFNSFVSMPLWTKEKLMGVLNLGHMEPNMYKRDEIKDYKTIAVHISMVMDKILLRREMVEQNELLRKTLKQLKEAQKKLIEKERLAAIGEIVVTVNHEINNPLTSIIGLAEVLELTFQTGDEEKVKKGLKAILKESKRIKKVTEKLTQINTSEAKTYVGSSRMTKLPV